MATDSNRPSFAAFQSQAELELLHLILQQDEAYPWNPADPSAVAYFDDLEQQVVAMGFMTDEIALDAQSFTTQLDQMWASFEPAPTAPARVFNTNIFQQLSARVPQHFLDGIVQRAQEAVSSNLALADQLVLCVQELLPVWNEEDLQVFARPFAYSMRGPVEADALESALRSVRDADWENLSPVEQARLSLAIARYTIAQVEEEVMGNG